MKTITTSVLALVLAIGAADAHEAVAGWRIGGSAMVSSLKRDDGLVDDSEIGFKVFGQYKFNRWLGLEGAYYNSGELASSATSAFGSKVDLLYQGGIGHALLFIPLAWESTEFFLKAGYFAFNVDSTIDGLSGGNGTDNGAAVGAGLSIHLTEKMHFRTTADWYDAEGADLWSFELGLEYLF